MFGGNRNGSSLALVAQVIKKQLIAMVIPALPFLAIGFVIMMVALIISQFFQGMIGIGSAGTSDCESVLEEEWAHFFNSEEEGTSFYSKINDLVEDHPGVDIALVSAIITFRSDISVDNNYKCNIGEEDGEGNVTKEECIEDLGENPAEDSKTLYKEAKEIVNGIKDKDENEIKQWLRDSYLEKRLKELEVEIPDDPESKADVINENVELIFSIRDMYKEAMCDENDLLMGGSCKFEVGDKTLNDVKVRLLGCTADGNSSGPLEDEELVDLEPYVLGVTYTENGGAPDEAIKMQAIAARSFALTRSYGGKIENENGSSIIRIRNCTWDQAYCNPDKGCWSNGLGGEYGNTIHSGYDVTKHWTRKPIDKNAKIRSLVAETAGQVVVDKNGKVLNTPYMSDVQLKWNAMATQGKSVIEMVKATYPNAVEITSNCSSGNGSIHGDPNFSNEKAWRPPNNIYAASSLYGQCTWFAWGRFYEIYGFSPGFTGHGYQCVDQLLAHHGDKFERSKKPKAGAVGSSDFAHNHVFVVVGVDGDKITIQEGNLNGKTDSWGVAIKDWQTITYTLKELRATYGDVTFANPKIPPK